MLSENSVVSIRFADEFEENVYRLSKRFRNIRKDIVSVIEQIQAGNFVGDRLAGLGEDYFVVKVRVKNSNIQKGKSAGYRLVYQVESAVSVLLLTIYSKSDRDDISASEVLDILASIFDGE
ncbi:type II toxin-antitoxin system RelE/ParE family toxin [Pseudanabaena biceps]|nr:type II toxin-antitoxin system RelE/ParE family toxin [Pseudanabaena biceps]